jgi:hypothetical protein
VVIAQPKKPKRRTDAANEKGQPNIAAHQKTKRHPDAMLKLLNHRRSDRLDNILHLLVVVLLFYLDELVGGTLVR